MKTEGTRTGVTRVDLGSLAVDLKRMLRVQLKELVHTIEDAEFEHGKDLFPDICKHSIVTRHNMPHVA
jgi:hypothetical protein